MYVYVYVMPLFSICHARVENEQTLFKGSDAYLNYLTIHQLWISSCPSYKLIVCICGQNINLLKLLLPSKYG